MEHSSHPRVAPPDDSLASGDNKRGSQYYILGKRRILGKWERIISIEENGKLLKLVNTKLTKQKKGKGVSEKHG